MRSVLFYGALLTVAMGASYATWTSEDVAASKPGEVPLYHASEGEVSTLQYKSDKLTVRVERRKDEAGAYTWVTVDETKETRTPIEKPPTDEEASPNPDDAGEAPSPTDEEQPEENVEITEEHSEFLGNENADNLFATFEPLIALRALEQGNASLSTFGLDDPEASLVIQRRSGETTIELGGKTYGSGNRYARHDDHLYLLKDTTLRSIRFAQSRLLERRVQPLQPNEIDKIVVERGADSGVFVQHNKDDPQASYWSAEGATEPDDGISGWMEKLIRLRGKSYIPADSVPQNELLLTAVIEGKWRVEIRQGDDEQLYVRSNFSRGVLVIRSADAQELVADAGDLFQN